MCERERERNVLANNDFRLRCDSRRSFRRAIRGEFLDAAMFLSTRCFSRTFSRFGSEAGQFFSRLLVGHCHTEEGLKGGGGGGKSDRRRGTRTKGAREHDRSHSLARIIALLARTKSRKRSSRIKIFRGLLVTLAWFARRFVIKKLKSKRTKCQAVKMIFLK